MQNGPEDGADDECSHQVDPARPEVRGGEPRPAHGNPEGERRGAKHEQQHERIPTHLPLRSVVTSGIPPTTERLGPAGRSTRKANDQSSQGTLTYPDRNGLA